MSRKDGYTKGNLPNYVYHQNKYKLVGIDILRRRKQVFLNKVISQEYQQMIKQQWFLLLKCNKKLF